MFTMWFSKVKHNKILMNTLKCRSWETLVKVNGESVGNLCVRVALGSINDSVYLLIYSFLKSIYSILHC